MSISKEKTKNDGREKYDKIIKEILAIIIAVLFFTVFYYYGFLLSWRNKLIDNLFVEENQEVPIIIIAIDNKSIQSFGQWPWDRKIHAQIIDKISKNDPAVIGYDVNFPESSNEEADNKLAEAIKNSGKVVLPIEGTIDRKNKKLYGKKFLKPIEEIYNAAKATGITNLDADKDGIVRRSPIMVMDEENKIVQTFSKQIALFYSANTKKKLSKELLESSESYKINYIGAPGKFTRISAVDFLNNDFDRKKIKDSIVLVGSTAPNLHDEYMTPASKGEPMSGVEILANQIHTIIIGNNLSEIGFLGQFLIFFLLAIFVFIFFHKFKVRIAAFLSLGLFIIYLIIVFHYFDNNLILDIFYSFLLIIVASFISIASKYLSEEKEKRFIKNIFSRYLSKDVIRELINDPKKLELGGENRELTVLFSDVRSFTSISEKLDAHSLTKLLNIYFTYMTNVIMNTNGVVDKYIGDAIMAFWGAPLKTKDHAQKAAESALQMKKILDKKRKKWKKIYDVDINIGIGINTGEVVVGNMGSDQRFDYTVMGDPVNLSSRLEGLTKTYGVIIAVSEFTYEKIKEKFSCRYLDKVVVKGKKQGIKVFELVGKKGELTKKQKILIKNFNKATALYRNKKWKKSLKIFRALHKHFPKDEAIKIYIKRCGSFIENDPGKKWDGVFIMQTK